MKQLLDQVLQIAIDAGQEILSVYNGEFDVEIKGDGSPLTTADRRAHTLIENRLNALEPKYPVLSEESSKEALEDRLQWQTFWLVDPLDGTKEFVKRNGEFTVNIALIDNGQPVLGVVHTPVQSISHYAAQGIGAFKQDQEGIEQNINVKPFSTKKAVMVASRSHAGEAVSAYRENLAKTVDELDIASMGSSLKICLVAEGNADIYPRLAPTSEWDTAAAHCVLAVAGGRMTDTKGNDLRYNKANILNPWFLASADKRVNWLDFLPQELN